MEQVKRIVELCEKVMMGGQIERAEVEELAKVDAENLSFLLAAADKIRRKYIGDRVDACAIVNGRSGRCSEDCKYCAQSKHHQTDVAVYPLLDEEELLRRAKEAENGGAARFAIVTSGKGMEGDREFPKILAATRRILRETNLKVCCSLGALTKETARALKESGVTRYHHNIETSRAHYAQVCATHTYDDRLATIRIAQEAGLEICSGGILNLGETMADRIDMAFELREMKVDSVPLNLLTPIPGTPFADRPPLAPLEILRSFALFRFILPQRGIRTAGGREVNLRDLQAMALVSGVDSIMVGGYLTTGGRGYDTDCQMLADLERPFGREGGNDE